MPSWKKVITSGSDATLNDITLSGDLSIPVAKKLYFGGSDHTYIGEDVDDRLRFFVGGDEFMRFTQQDAGGEIFSIYQDVYLSDSVPIHFGASNDLKIVHDGSNSVIKADGTGNLTIRQDTADADILFRCDDGSGGVATYLSLDGSATKVQVDKNMVFSDDVQAQFGGNVDLRIYSDDSNSYIDNENNDLIIQNDATDKDIILKTDDGSGGVTPYITLDGSAGLTQIDKNMKFIDSVSAYFGNSSDLQIFHNGTNSFGADNYTGHLIFQNRADDSDIIFKTDDGSGGVATYLTLDGSESNIDIAVDTALAATKKFYLDGGSNTYIHEPSGDQIGLVTGGNTRVLVQGHKTYINSTGANGLVINNDEGTTTNSGRIFLEGNTTTALMQEADDFSIRTGAVTGTSSGTERFRVNTSGADVTGTLTATGDVVAYYSSDKRLKDNIVRIENPLEKVGKIGGYTFDWNDKQETYTGKDVGVIAQEIQEVLPELVTERDNGYLAVKYEKMVPLLIESIKELKQEIDDIKQKCDCLNN